MSKKFNLNSNKLFFNRGFAGHKKNNIMLFSDLKVFIWAGYFKDIYFFSILKHVKDPRTSYFANRLWWRAFYNFFDNLFYSTDLYSIWAKDYIIYQNTGFFNKMQDVYPNSEVLLLSVLKSLYFLWVSLLPVIFDIFIYTNKLQDLDLGCSLLVSENSKLYEPWRCLLPLINEIINLLHKFGSKFAFEDDDLDPECKLDYWPLYINSVLPRLYLDDVFLDLNAENRREKLKILIKYSFLYTNELIKFAVLGPRFLYFTEEADIVACEKKLFKNNVLIERFLEEITLGISYETIKFLIHNPLIDIAKLRVQLFMFSSYIMFFFASRHYFI